MTIRQGKGKKDRYDAHRRAGRRVARKVHLDQARPQLATEPDDMTVFLTAQGEPLGRNHAQLHHPAIRSKRPESASMEPAIFSATRWPR